MSPELEFVRRLQENDETAFRELFDRFGTLVYNTSLGILQEEEDASDITQEVFISAFQSIKGFKGDSKLSTWLYKISVTKSLEHLRKKKRKKRSGLTISLFGSGESIKPLNENSFYHPGVQLENKERAAILFGAIDLLPENQKVAFILNKVECLSYQETAEVMEISVSSVESLIFRAKQRLQVLLKDYYENNEK
jgi:RNA polymerase sigma factor (sigma-70 family)